MIAKDLLNVAFLRSVWCVTLSTVCEITNKSSRIGFTIKQKLCNYFAMEKFIKNVPLAFHQLLSRARPSVGGLLSPPRHAPTVARAAVTLLGLVKPITPALRHELSNPAYLRIQ